MDFLQLLLGQKLAQGADSIIYRAVYNNKQVAVKILQHRDQQEDEDEEEEEYMKSEDQEKRLQKLFDDEVNILSRLRHENVVEFVASYSKTPLYCILTEFCSEGSLKSYLSKLKSSKTRLSLDRVVDLALKIARGMEYVHSQGVIHRDIKPDNVLIDHNFRLKIADFGASCEEKKNDFRTAGTLRWMAPEMIARKKYGRKVDVYSFGLILYQMVSGNVPFGSMSPYQVTYGVANKNLRPEIPEDCSEFLRGLIERCWCKNPKKRPEFSEIVKVLEEFDANESCVYQDKKKGLLFHLMLKCCISI